MAFHTTRQSPYHSQMRQSPPQVSPGVLLGVSLWRLLIVVFAWIGFGDAVRKSDGLADALQALSQQASLVAGLVYLGLLVYPVFRAGRLHEPWSPWLRGAMALVLLLVAVTYNTMLEGDLSTTSSLFEHLLTPLVVLIDWVFVGRNQGGARWWYPLSWLGLPLAYLIYFYVARPDLYGSILDPDDSGFFLTVLEFLVALVVAGYLLYGVGKVKALAGGRTTGSGGDRQPDLPTSLPGTSEGVSHARTTDEQGSDNTGSL